MKLPVNQRIQRDQEILKHLLHLVECRIPPALWEEPYAQIFAQAVVPRVHPQYRPYSLEQVKGIWLLSKVLPCRPVLESIPDWIWERSRRRVADWETAAERVRHDHRRFSALLTRLQHGNGN